MTKAELDDAFMKVIAQIELNNLYMAHPSILFWDQWETNPRFRRRTIIEGIVFFALMVGAIVAVGVFV